MKIKYRTYDIIKTWLLLRGYDCLYLDDFKYVKKALSLLPKGYKLVLDPNTEFNLIDLGYSSYTGWEHPPSKNQHMIGAIKK